MSGLEIDYRNRVLHHGRYLGMVGGSDPVREQGAPYGGWGWSCFLGHGSGLAHATKEEAAADLLLHDEQVHPE